MIVRLVCIPLGVLALLAASFAVRGDDAARPARVLFVTQSKGFQHGSVRRRDTLAPAEIAMIQLGQQTGLFKVDCTQDCEHDFTKDNLKNYDIVMFYTTGDLPIKESDSNYFYNDWLKQKGHGFVGFHSATDTYHEYQPYWEMIGATFVTHPWNSNKTVTITVDDPNHPASRPWPKEFTFKDEIYRYRHWQPDKVHVLMSLNIPKCLPVLGKDHLDAYRVHKSKGPGEEPYQVPIAWVKNYGDGKVFYINLGHNEKTWTNPIFLKSVEGGIRWIMGIEKGDATPNPEISKSEEDKARAALGLNTTSAR